LAPREVPLHPSFIPEAKAGGRLYAFIRRSQLANDHLPLPNIARTSIDVLVLF
jgi:hypothetical protein